MALLTVEQLYYYPVKSLRGIAVDSLDLSDFGPLNDRRWMIVDSDGKFVTQREQPRLAQVSAQLTSSGCSSVSPPSRHPLTKPLSLLSSVLRALP